MWKKLLPIILFSTLLSESFACSGGVSFDLLSGLPAGYRSIQNERDFISGFVKEKLNRTDWVYANDNLEIKIEEIAGNGAVIPVTINMDNKNEGISKNKLMLFAEKNINVLTTKGKDIKIPHHNQQLPINYALPTTNATMLIWVATYNLETPIKSVSMRLNLQDTEKAKIIALFIPGDKTKPIKVVRQKGFTHIHKCNFTIYVDGPLPEGAENGFYYF